MTLHDTGGGGWVRPNTARLRSKKIRIRILSCMKGKEVNKLNLFFLVSISCSA